MSYLDPPDFETTQEIIEDSFTLEEAKQFALCYRFIHWYDNDTCDDDLTQENESKYTRCVEDVQYRLDWIKSCCQDHELDESEIIEELLRVGE